MGLKDQIKERVEDYLDGTYSVSDGYTIPTRGDLTFGKTAKKLKCNVLYADLRGSKKIVSDHGHTAAIRIHKCFLYVVAKCVKKQGGYIRSFNGDSVLCFFKNNDKESAKAAVKAAMNIKSIIHKVVNPKLRSKYSTTIDYGVGIAQGEVYVAKSGFQGDESYQDLIWVGWPTYVAHAFGDAAKSPYNIWISEHVYGMIKNDSVMRYSNGKDMWEHSLECTGVGCRDVYKTHYMWSI